MRATFSSEASLSSLSGAPPNWPDIHVMEIGGRGMIFRTHRSFELGDSLSLGLHLFFRSAEEGEPEPSGSDFMMMEGVVVDCRKLSWAGESPLFQVTLVFPLVSEEECALLAAAGRLQPEAEPAGMLEPELASMETVAGLN